MSAKSIRQLRIDLTETDVRQYKSIAREARIFAKLYGKYVDDKMINDAIDDFLYAMRTHLLMKNFKMKKIDEYIRNVIVKNQLMMTEKTSGMSSKLKDVSSKMINRFNECLSTKKGYQ